MALASTMFDSGVPLVDFPEATPTTPTDPLAPPQNRLRPMTYITSMFTVVYGLLH